MVLPGDDRVPKSPGSGWPRSVPRGSAASTSRSRPTGPPHRRAPAACASPISSTGATPAAVARASTPATWPASWWPWATRWRSSPASPGPCSTRAWGSPPCPVSTCTATPTPSGCRTPASSGSSIDLLEFGVMCTAGFPEPRTFSLRARRLLQARRHDFDIVHDNQCLGSGLLGMIEDGWPLLTTLHHPITVDRELALSHAENAYRRLTQRRWFGFLGMQKRVAAQLPRIVTVSESSKLDIAAQMGVAPVPHDRGARGRRPHRVPPPPRAPPGPGPHHGDVVERRAHEGPRAPARGGGQAAHRARHRAGRHRQAPGGRPGGAHHRPPGPGAGRALRQGDLRRRAGLSVRRGRGGGGALAVRRVLAPGHRGHGVWGARSSPPRAGRCPRWWAPTARPALLVTPDDPEALAGAIRRIFDDPDLAARLGEGGRARVLGRFTWEATAPGHPRAVPGGARRAPPGFRCVAGAVATGSEPC